MYIANVNHDLLQATTYAHTMSQPQPALSTVLSRVYATSFLVVYLGGHLQGVQTAIILSPIPSGQCGGMILTGNKIPCREIRGLCIRLGLLGLGLNEPLSWGRR